MKSKILLSLIILLPLLASGQEKCDCEKTFEWVRETFSKNDAGYQYSIDKNGVEFLNYHTAKQLEKAKKATTYMECSKIMNDWLMYFRKGHIGVSLKNYIPEVKRSVELVTVDLTEQQLIKSLSERKDVDPIEGIWTNENFRIGITANDEKNGFVGFVLETKDTNYKAKDIKAVLEARENGEYPSIFLMGADRNEYRSQASFFLDYNNVLYIAGMIWLRAYPENTLTEDQKFAIRINRSQIPFVKKLNDQTLYLRIPSFRAEKKAGIDKVLAENDELIKSMPNLIIDIRNGTGGSDFAFQELLPYLYTNQYTRSFGMEYLATEENKKGYEKYSDMFLRLKDTAFALMCGDIAKQMGQNMGKFFEINKAEGSDDFLKNEFDTVFQYPKRVGIICNKRNGSTDEQFLLMAKQSRKVKVFGQPTAGLIDIGNVNSVISPDGKFEMFYGMTKSLRMLDYKVDDIGIQPDYFIPRTHPKSEWIDYVQSVLEEN